MTRPGTSAFDPPEPTPSADEIRTAVDRVAASEGFRRSARLVAMLRYVVEHALSHPDRPLKEYRLGVEVFGLDADYDTRLDPVVRVEMRRLRQRLADYYADAGRDDPMRIDVPRGGYAATFVRATPGPGLVVPPAPDAPAAPVPAPEPAAREAVRPGASRTREAEGRPMAFPAIAVALLVLVLGGLSVFRHAPVSPSDQQGPGPTRVLVTAVSDAPLDRQVTGRLLDEVVEALSRLGELRVVAPDPGAREAGGQRPAVDGELALRTDRLADGSSRLSIRLTETASGSILWTRAFDLSSPPDQASRASIVGAVVGAIRMRLEPDSGQKFIRRGNDDEHAWTLYREARALANTREPEALGRSLSLYQQAVARDPGFALAFAGIADVLAVQLANGLVEPGVGLAAAQAAAARAHALDPALGEALAHLAYFEGFVNWRWEQSLADFRRAIAVTPHHARAHAWHGQTLLALARFDEAIDALLQAQRLDPAAGSITQALGEAYYYAGRYDDVRAQARRLLQADPEHWGGHYLLARTAIALGERRSALEALQRSRGELWSDVSRLVVNGDCAGARDRLAREGGDLARRQPFHIASLYALAGEPERALAWLTRAVAQRQIDVASIAIDPPLRVLHGRPDYQVLVARVGLSAPADATPGAPGGAPAPCS